MDQASFEVRNQFEAGNGNRDKFRAVPLTTIRFECNTNNLVFEGEVLGVGKYEMPIYSDRLDKAQALVEKFPEKVAEAKRLYAKEEAELGADSSARRMYTSWPAAYRILTGGQEPKPFNFLEVVSTSAPPKGEDELKASATTEAIVKAVLGMQGEQKKKQ